MIKVPPHPVWSLLRYVATLIAAGFAMFLFCTEFDETEWKSLTAFAGVFGVGEFLRSQVKAKKTE